MGWKDNRSDDSDTLYVCMATWCVGCGYGTGSSEWASDEAIMANDNRMCPHRLPHKADEFCRSNMGLKQARKISGDALTVCNCVMVAALESGKLDHRVKEALKQ